MKIATDENSSYTPESMPLPYSSHASSSPSAAPIELDYIPLPASSHLPPAPPQNPHTSSNTPYPAPPSTQYTHPGHASSSSYAKQQQHPYQPVLSSVTVVDTAAAAAAAVDPTYTDKFQPKEVQISHIQHIFNPKKKTFWVFWIIVLAIVFGVLGGTVWKPYPKEEDIRSPPASNGGSGEKPDWVSCSRGCSAVSKQCDNSCRSSDSVFQSCVNKCAGAPHCDFDCRMGRPCFDKCNDDWGKCASACS